MNKILRRILALLTGIVEQGPMLFIGSPYYKDRTSLFQSLSNTNKSIVFVGDSLIEGCEWHELLESPYVKNRGISGDNTYGLLHRIDNIIESKPDKIFLMIGINDLNSGNDVSQITDNYNEILSQVTKKLPNTKVYVHSVLPINSNLYHCKKAINKKIISLNKEIERLSQSYFSSYIDLYNVMSGQDGQLKSDLTNDGLHLNGNGYNVWKNSITKYVFN
ncbi:MAG: lipase [Synergistaceae bacterium]|nr:lipase [Synergistaceae bacterium]NLV82322.1 lipase [Synergistaceae bacterium]